MKIPKELEAGFEAGNIGEIRRGIIEFLMREKDFQVFDELEEVLDLLNKEGINIFEEYDPSIDLELDDSFLKVRMELEKNFSRERLNRFKNLALSEKRPEPIEKRKWSRESKRFLFLFIVVAGLMIGLVNGIIAKDIGISPFKLKIEMDKDIYLP